MSVGRESRSDSFVCNTSSQLDILLMQIQWSVKSSDLKRIIWNIFYTNIMTHNPCWTGVFMQAQNVHRGAFGPKVSGTLGSRNLHSRNYIWFVLIKIRDVQCQLFQPMPGVLPLEYSPITLVLFIHTISIQLFFWCQNRSNEAATTVEEDSSKKYFFASTTRMSEYWYQQPS